LNPIPEKDWKAYKRIRARAIDRFARRSLAANRGGRRPFGAMREATWTCSSSGPSNWKRRPWPWHP